MRTAASQTQVVVRGSGRGVLSIRGRTEIKQVHPRPVYDLLVDPRTHTKWIPGLKSVRMARTPGGVLVLDEVHEINFLAFGHSFSTRLAMKPDPVNCSVTFDLVSSDLYRHYTTTFTAHTGTSQSSTTSPTSCAASSSPHTYAQPSTSGQADIPYSGRSQQFQQQTTGYDAASSTGPGTQQLVTIVQLEGELALKISPPGPFGDLLVQSMQKELTTTLTNIGLELRKQ